MKFFQTKGGRFFSSVVQLSAYISAVTVSTAFVGYYLALAANTTIGNNITTSGTLTVTGNSIFSSKIGIGTTSPMSALSIHSSSGAASALTNINLAKDAVGEEAILSQFGVDGLDANSISMPSWIGTYSSDSFSIITNNLERFKITSQGKLGIGTTTPASLFSLQGDGLVSGTFSVAGLVATGTTRFNNVTYTWPSADGSSGQVLSTNGSGTLSWATGGGGGGGVGAGTIGQIPYYASAGSSVAATSTITINTDRTISFAGNLLPSTASASTSVANASTSIEFSWSGGEALDLIIGNDNLPLLLISQDSSAPNNSLLIVHCGNSTCTSGNATATLDFITSGFEDVSFAIGSDGFPVISYLQSVGNSLKVAHCGDATCSSGNSTTTVETGLGSGQRNSIAIGTDGFPVIAFIDNDDGDLRFVHCDDVACNSETPILLDSAPYSISDVTVGIAGDGTPVIAYRWDTITGVKSLSIYKCDNSTCTSGNTRVIYTNGSTNGDGSYSRLEINNHGLPVIVFDSLRFWSTETLYRILTISCSDYACSGNTQLAEVFGLENENGGPQTIDLAIGSDNLPIIGVVNTYELQSENTLWSIKCGSENCQNGTIANEIEQKWTGGSANGIAVAVNSSNIPSFLYLWDGPTDDYITFNKCGNVSCDVVFPATFSGGVDLGTQNSFFHNAYIESVFANQIKIKRFDLAEDYYSADDLQAGDIVSLDADNPFHVHKAKLGDGSRVIGVVSTEPALVLSDYLSEPAAEDTNYPIALAGRVPVKVSLEGGDVQIGNAISISSQDGIGRKAGVNNSEMFIGYALESLNGTSDTIGTIKVFVSRSGQGGGPVVLDASMGIKTLSDTVIFIVREWLSDMKVVFENSLIKLDALMANKIRTKEFELEDSETGDIYCVKIQNGQLVNLPGDCAGQNNLSTTTASEISESASSTPELIPNETASSTNTQ